ncbi:MAG: bifunctional phosphopantothenoylcysteine decarboxylase/phosphopantothenate--cysteine ligase CoaBC [Lactobacillaceae bacterium]|jgi:phosphopantothenoylcysteine decarboxylase/phosphopantothenate--cysteine ligase|nr:bifunctional phosphopantothenoylcysteine decarboxylase/phosphopantothenate--cysteine ligase CoaBC [Lactobacillaceae bacterium]
MFNDKKVVLIVTGGIAAYKAAIFARLLMKEGAVVKVVMTKAATEFVTPKTFSTLTKQPVLTDLFAQENEDEIAHIHLADWADYLFVVPATANMIAKISQGIADDAASTLIQARSTPLIVAPAMNSNMYQNPATQRNLALLRQDGVIIIEPANGMLAEGYTGAGRLPEPDDLLHQAEMRLRQLQPTNLAGKNFLVTAGGTKEAIDPVRFIGNHSSGKMGYALAQALLEAGAHVTLVSTVELALPFGAELVQVQTAQEMFTELEQRFPNVDGLVMAAAVADYRPETVAQNKIKKQNHEHLKLEFTENVDIVATLGEQKQNQFVVAFAAETQDLLQHAADKLKRKHADMLIANDVTKNGAGFAGDTNQVTILTPDGNAEPLELMSKIETARAIVKRIAKRIN